MRIRSLRFICSTVALFSLAVLFAGCAQQMRSVKEDGMIDAGSTATLQAVKVSEDGNQVTISANKPLTYTFYKVASPLKVVLDISQAEPGAITAPIESATGHVKLVEVSRQGVGLNVLSRVEISLASDSPFTVTTDAEDKGKLLVTFAKPQTAQAEPRAEAVIEQKPITEENLTPPAPAGNGTAQKPVTAGTVASAKVEESRARTEEKKSSPVAKEGTGKPAPRQTRIVTAVNAVTDGVEIVVPGGVESFSSFKLSKPARLVVDIPGVKDGIASRAIELKRFGIDRARLGSSAGKVRLVFDVAQVNLPPYRIEKSESGLKILLQGVSTTQPPKTAAKTAPAPATQQRAETAPAPPVRRSLPLVESIDFKSDGGYSQIIVKVNGACVADKPTKNADGWGLTIKNCQLPVKLQRMLDTSAFVSAVREITPYQVKIKGGYSTKLQVKTRLNVPFNFRQEGDTIFWSFKNPETAPLSGTARKEEPPVAVAARNVGKPVASVKVPAVDKHPAVEKRPAVEKQPVVEKQPPATPESGKKVYTGRKVTLEFSDADVRKIFQLIAEVSGYNFLISDDVSGTISLKLVNVPWDQALDVILDSKNLEMKRENNIVQIKPKGKFKTQEEEDALLSRAREKRMPMQTKVFEVNFASIPDVTSKFEKLSSKPLGTEASIIPDERTHRVIVVDNAVRIKKMEDLLAKIDTPEKQVLIEARIVEATSTFVRDLGVQWGIHYKDGSASIMGINQLDTGFGGVLTQTPPTTGFQSFDSAGGAMGLSFGKLTSNVQVDMRISAAATAGLIKIISTPKVVTLNNKQANIQQGQSIPYQTTSAEGTKTMFVQATLSLDVTPHISADGSIGMKIIATNNSAAPTPLGVPPSINIKTATTELQVMNGETTVIGGIYVDSDQEIDSGVPFLMDIPLLGWLFKSNDKQKTRTELLIFITPRVVS